MQQPNTVLGTCGFTVQQKLCLVQVFIAALGAIK
jgi:hypothetical protein